MKFNKPFKIVLTTSLLTCGSLAMVTSATSCVSLSSYQQIDIADPLIQKSPYNWYQSTVNGHNVCTTQPGGAYLQVDFTGTTIGLNAYCSSSFPARILLTCYIDGSSVGISKTLDEQLGNILIFTDKLSNDEVHHAKIVVSSIADTNDSWKWADSINILDILIQKNKQLQPIVSSSKKVLIYGDSYVEANYAGAEHEPFAQIATKLQYQYGQVGLGGETLRGIVGAPKFFDSTNLNPYTNNHTGWNNYYDNNDCGRWDPDNQNYFSGAPDFIVNNVGYNDALFSNDADAETDASSAASQYAAWVDYMLGMTALNDTKLFLVMPYRFDCQSTRVGFWHAWHEAFETTFFEKRNSYKDNVFILDLGPTADWVISRTSINDSTPSVATYNWLEAAIENLALNPFAPTDATPSAPNNPATLGWTPNPDKRQYGIIPIVTNWQARYRVSGNEEWEYEDLVGYSASSIATPTLSTGTYDFQIGAINELSNITSWSETNQFIIT
ncbi:MAG: hypothetical protein LBS76_01180 [Mycoplasmataceae bacterium]|jgi:hypothetical protein|nr:hypothetical protein [Mycoplasmataceae bacterium]